MSSSRRDHGSKSSLAFGFFFGGAAAGFAAAGFVAAGRVVPPVRGGGRHVRFGAVARADATAAAA
ncbi:MAG TPA: hypothetical protein VHB21_23625, partial [Minicystis sp.]|nr:hypothetical protein [Minicystis sp.]